MSPFPTGLLQFLFLPCPPTHPPPPAHPIPALSLALLFSPQAGPGSLFRAALGSRAHSLIAPLSVASSEIALFLLPLFKAGLPQLEHTRPPGRNLICFVYPRTSAWHTAVFSKQLLDDCMNPGLQQPHFRRTHVVPPSACVQVSGCLLLLLAGSLCLLQQTEWHRG